MSKLLWLGFLLVSVSADCDMSCLTCGADGMCLSCAPNAVLQNNVCVCAAGSFPQATVPLSCALCNPYCKTCSGPSEFECLSCPSETANVGPTPSRCVCETNPNLSLCSSCYQTCSTCNYNAPTVCTTCRPGFEMYSGFCVPQVRFPQVWATYSYFFDSTLQSLRALPNNRREQADIYLKFGTVRTMQGVTLQLQFPSVYKADGLLGINCELNGVKTVCKTDGNLVKVNVPSSNGPIEIVWLTQNSLVIHNVTNPDFEGGTGFFYMSIRENRQWRDDVRTQETSSYRFYSREYGRFEDTLREQGQLPYETKNLDTQIWKTVESRRDQEAMDYNIPIGTLGVSPAVDSLLAGEVVFAGSQEMATPTGLDFKISPKGVLRQGDTVRLTIDPQFDINAAGLACAFLMDAGGEENVSCSVSSGVIESSLSSSLSSLGVAFTLRVRGLTNPAHSIDGCTQFRAEIRRGWSILERLDIQGPKLLPGRIDLVRRAGADIQDMEYAETNSVANLTVAAQHWVPAGGSIVFVFDSLEINTSLLNRQNICYRYCEVHTGVTGLNGGSASCGRFDSNSFVVYNIATIAPGTPISVSMYVRETTFMGNLVAVRSLDANNRLIDEMRTEGIRKPLDAIHALTPEFSLTSYVANATTGIHLKFSSPHDLLENSILKLSLPTGPQGFLIQDKLDCVLKLDEDGGLKNAKRLKCTPDDQHVTITFTYPVFAGHNYIVDVKPSKGGCLGEFRNPMKPGCYPVGVKLYSVLNKDVPVALRQTAFAIDTRGANPEESEVFLWTRPSTTADATGKLSLSLPTIWTIYYTPGLSLPNNTYVAFMLMELARDLNANTFRSTYCFRNETEVPYTNATLPGFPPAPLDMRAYQLYGQDSSALDGDLVSGFKFWFPTGLLAAGTYRFDVLGVAGNGKTDTALYLAAWKDGELQQYGKVKDLTGYFASATAFGRDTGDILPRSSFDKYFPGEVADISFEWFTNPTEPMLPNKFLVRDMYFAVALPSGFQLTPSAAITFKKGSQVQMAQHTTSFNSPQYALIWGWTDGTVYLNEGATYTITISGVQIPYDKCSVSGQGAVYAGSLGKAPLYTGLLSSIPLWFNRTQIAPSDIAITLGAANELISNFAVSFPITQTIPWNGYIVLTMHRGFIFDYVQKCIVTGGEHHSLCLLNSIENILNITDLGPVKPGTILTITLDKVRMPNTQEAFEPVQIVTYGCCVSETCSGLEESKYFLVTLKPAIPSQAKVLKVQYWPINIGYPGELLVVFKLNHELLPRSRVILGVPLALGTGDLSATCRLLNMTGETWQITPDSFHNGKQKYLVSYTSCVADSNFVNITFSNYIPANAIMGLHLTSIVIPSGPLNFWPGMDYINVPTVFNNFSVWSESYNRTVDTWLPNPSLDVTSLTPVAVNFTFDRLGTRPLIDVDPSNQGEYKTFTFAFKTPRAISASEVFVVTFGSSASWFNQIYLYQSNLDNEVVANCWSERTGLLDCQTTGNRVYVYHRTAFSIGQEVVFLIRRPIPNESAGAFPVTIWCMSGSEIKQSLSTSVSLLATLPPAPLDTVSLTSSSSLAGGKTDLSISFNYGSYSTALTVKVSFNILYMWYSLDTAYDCSLYSSATATTFVGRCSASLAWKEVALRVDVPKEYWRAGNFVLTVKGFPNPSDPDTYSVSTLALYNAATKRTEARTYGQYSSPLSWLVSGPGSLYLVCDIYYVAMTAGAVSQPIHIWLPSSFLVSTIRLDAVVKALGSDSQQSYKFHLREPVVINQGDEEAWAYIVAAEDVTPGTYFVTWVLTETSSTGRNWYSAPGDVNIRVTGEWQNVTVSPINFVPAGGDSMPMDVTLTTSPATALNVTITTNDPWLVPYPSQLVFGPSDLSRSFILSADRRLSPGNYSVHIAISGPSAFHLSTPDVPVTVLQYGSLPGTIVTQIVGKAESVLVRQVRSQPGVGYFMVAPQGVAPLLPKDLVQAVHSGIIPSSALDHALASDVSVFRRFQDRFEITPLKINFPYVLYSCLVNSFGLPGPVGTNKFTVFTEPRFLATLSVAMYAGEDSSEVVQQALALAIGAQMSDFVLKEVVESNMSRFGHVTNFTYYVNTMTFGNYEREPNLNYLAAAAPDLIFTGVSLYQFDMLVPNFLTTPKILLTKDSVQVSVLLDSSAVVGVVLADANPLNSFQIINGLASNDRDATAAVRTKVVKGEATLLQLQRPQGNFTVWVAAENDVPFYPLRTNSPFHFEVLDGLVTK